MGGGVKVVLEISESQMRPDFPLRQGARVTRRLLTGLNHPSGSVMLSGAWCGAPCPPADAAARLGLTCPLGLTTKADMSMLSAIPVACACYPGRARSISPNGPRPYTFSARVAR